MDKNDISLILSVIASSLAVLSFCGTVWRVWRDRPRLHFIISKAIFKQSGKRDDLEMVRVRACNIGYRSIILTSCIFSGEQSWFHLGSDDEPYTVSGIEKQVFPSIVEPGQTLTFHPIAVSSLDRNTTEPNDQNFYYGPWKYFFVFDSFNRAQAIRIADLRWALRLDKSWTPLTGLDRVKSYVESKRLMRKARKELNFI